MSVDPITSETLTALLDGATPGPWEWLTKAGAGEYYLYGDACTGIKDNGATTADLDLAALAPTLAAEVLALRARVAELEGRTVPELPKKWQEIQPGVFRERNPGELSYTVRGSGSCLAIWHHVPGCGAIPGTIPRAVLLRALGVPDAP